MSIRAVFVHRMGPTFASYRYRAAIPAQAIGGTVNGGEANVLIFSKPTPDDIRLARESKADGIKIVADIGDDHFRHSVWGPVYLELVTLADAIVTPTANMASRIMKYTGLSVATVIPDPYEEDLRLPHANFADQAKCLWFGSETNLKDLAMWRPILQRYDLTIVTGTNHQGPFAYLPWSPRVQTEELAKAHLVLLPTRQGVEYKSPNRLVNALRAGCFVVGSAHPAHHEFRQFVWAGSLATGLEWAHYFKGELNDMVTAGQRYCEKFSPERVGQQWTQLLETVCQ